MVTTCLDVTSQHQKKLIVILLFILRYMGLHVIRNEIGLQTECILGGKILQCDNITEAYVKHGNFMRNSVDVTLREYLYHDVVKKLFLSL